MRAKHEEIGRRVLAHPATLASREAIPASDHKDETLMTVVNLRAEERPGNREAPWATKTTQAFQAIIENCRLTGQMGLLSGGSGIGKTTSARAAVRAARATSDDMTYLPTIALVTMTRAAQKLQPGLLRIAQAADIAVSNHWGAHDLHEAIAQHSWQAGSLIVLDEAQFMSDDLLHGTRSLRDELEERGKPVGIVLVGTLDLHDRINGQGKKAIPFEALRGRLGASVAIRTIESDDCTEICRHYGIHDKKAQTLIAHIARQPGGLHNVRRLLNQVPPGEERITLALLQQAAQLSGVSS